MFTISSTWVGPTAIVTSDGVLPFWLSPSKWVRSSTVAVGDTGSAVVAAVGELAEAAAAGRLEEATAVAVLVEAMLGEATDAVVRRRAPRAVARAGTAGRSGIGGAWWKAGAAAWATSWPRAGGSCRTWTVRSRTMRPPPAPSDGDCADTIPDWSSVSVSADVPASAMARQNVGLR